MSAIVQSPRLGAPAPVGGSLVTPLTLFLGALVACMAGVLVVRFASGLGATTNLNDGYPWGIWIAFDDITGSGLATGGFVTALLIHVLNRGAFSSLERPVILAGLIGYMIAGVSVMVDIGRYLAFWHILWPGYAQPNSALFWISALLTGYMGVLFVLFLPVLLEWLGWVSAKRFLGKFLFIFLAGAIVLPMAHQSSLGAALIVLGPQLHPLYLTPLLPLLFFVSCIPLGTAAVVLDETLTSAGLRRPIEAELFGRLLQIARVVLGAFVVIRIADVIVRGVLPLALTYECRAGAFWVENILMAAPIFMLASESARRSPRRLFVTAVLMIIAGTLYRMDTYLLAYDTGAGWTYFPSFGEIAVTAGFIALEVLTVIVAIRLLPILPRVESDAAAPAANGR